jgi:hypothetical protein
VTIETFLPHKPAIDTKPCPPPPEPRARLPGPPMEAPADALDGLPMEALHWGPPGAGRGSAQQADAPARPGPTAQPRRADQRDAAERAARRFSSFIIGGLVRASRDAVEQDAAELDAGAERDAAERSDELWLVAAEREAAAVAAERGGGRRQRGGRRQSGSYGGRRRAAGGGSAIQAAAWERPQQREGLSTPLLGASGGEPRALAAQRPTGPPPSAAIADAGIASAAAGSALGRAGDPEEELVADRAAGLDGGSEPAGGTSRRGGWAVESDGGGARAARCVKSTGLAAAMQNSQVAPAVLTESSH